MRTLFFTCFSQHKYLLVCKEKLPLPFSVSSFYDTDRSFERSLNSETLGYLLNIVSSNPHLVGAHLSFPAASVTLVQLMTIGTRLATADAALNVGNDSKNQFGKCCRWRWEILMNRGMLLM
jgi:hypothetical protein